ncbi:MAG TPA: hypothetical protein GX528_04310 [Firmicutes bacterium]|nr:hypothetical protein [Bacillota bacterium]
MQKDEERVEIMGDIVSLKALVQSIIISSIATMGAYFLAPAAKTQQLFLGLSGAVIGFVISALSTEPKRRVVEENNLNESKEK